MPGPGRARGVGRAGTWGLRAGRARTGVGADRCCGEGARGLPKPALPEPLSRRSPFCVGSSPPRLSLGAQAGRRRRRAGAPDGSALPLGGRGGSLPSPSRGHRSTQPFLVPPRPRGAASPGGRARKVQSAQSPPLRPQPAPRAPSARGAELRGASVGFGPPGARRSVLCIVALHCHWLLHFVSLLKKF